MRREGLARFAEEPPRATRSGLVGCVVIAQVAQSVHSVRVGGPSSDVRCRNFDLGFRRDRRMLGGILQRRTTIPRRRTPEIFGFVDDPDNSLEVFIRLHERHDHSTRGSKRVPKQSAFEHSGSAC
jgi:hypothetical protein